MRRIIGCGVAILFVVVAPLRAAESRDEVVRETWDAAYLEGGKVGYYHTIARKIERDGKPLVRTTVELDLTLKRYRSSAHVRMETGTDETADGKVLGVFMRQFTGDNQQLLLTGTVEGDLLHVRTADGKVDMKSPWNDKVIGLYRQERIFQEHKVKPGDQFTYLSYEPMIMSVVTVRASVKEPEEVEVFGVKKRLLRAEAVPDKVRVAQGTIPLPTMVSWLDEELVPVRSQTDLPEIGKVVLYRTTRAVAMAQGAGPQGVDIGMKSLIRLDRRIPHPYETKSVVYRITVKEDDDPASTFAQDARQSAKDVKGDSFELHVHAIRTPQGVESTGEVPEEFTKSCANLNSDDSRIKDYARQAVGRETDPWRKAQLIERWVYYHVELDNSAPFATAGEVARSLRGDCRHKAMLSAALCRAAGVPSRTAVGLIYDDHNPQRNPVMAFHMWTEVWIAGQWLAIDGTIGHGSIGADHLKIADSSWGDVEALSVRPLLPVARVLGKVAIEVVRVDGEDQRR